MLILENHEMGCDIQYLCNRLMAAADEDDHLNKLPWHKPIPRYHVLLCALATEETSELLGKQASDCKVSEAVHARLSELPI